MPALDWMGIVLVLLATALAAFVQGFSGFGFGILAMALVSLVAPNPERVAVVMTLSGLVVQLALVAVSGRAYGIDWKTVLLLLAGILPGIPVGYQFLLHFGQMPLFRLFFGVVLFAFAANGALRPHLKRHVAWGYAPPLGVLSGVIAGAFASGGPPLVLYVYAREDDPRCAKGTLQTVFILAAVARVLVIQGTGPSITGDLLLWLAIVSPLVIGLTLLGHALANRVSVRHFRWGVYALIALAGMLQITRALGIGR